MVARLERTPAPVLFEVGHDASVSAFCENPEIPFDAEYEARPFVHSAAYRAKPSPAMETLMLRNARRNQRRRALRKEREEKTEYEQIGDKEEEEQSKVSLRSRMEFEDFHEDEDEYGDDEYDALADADADGDDDDGQEHMTHKVVLLDVE